jgi:hypothetical protein
MEHQAELERQMRSNLTAGRTEPEAPEIDYDKLDGEFLTSPAKAMAKILDARLSQEKKERDREKVVGYVTSARTRFETGKADAMKANPALFKGIGEDISREILGNVQAGLQHGQPVDTEILGNPKYWEAAAVAYRVMNGEDVTKFYSGTRTPMTPTYQDVPSAGGPPQAAPALTSQEMAMAQFLGGTPEQYAAAKAKVK